MSTYKLPLDDNALECIVVPLYSQWMMDLFEITVKSNDGFLSSYRQDWCWGTVFWDNQFSAEKLITINIKGNIDISGYDNIIFRCNMPDNCSFFLEFFIEENIAGKTQVMKGTGGHFEYIFPYGDTFELDHKQISVLTGIHIHLIVPPFSNDVMQISWLGLRSAVHEQVVSNINARRSFDWTPWLIPIEKRGPLRFLRGLAFSERDLDAVRVKAQSAGWRGHFTLLEKEAAAFFDKIPEERFGAYLPTSDARYSRTFVAGQTSYHWEALVLGFVGLVKNNQEYIEHALRYLMCMVHTMHWRYSGYERSASDPWSSRAFLEEMTTTSIAILYDWFYYALKPNIIQLIQSALWTRGIAFVRYDLLSNEHMHNMNQGIVFNRACILAGLMLESHLPRMRPYVDLAYTEMLSNAKNYIRPDGSVPEGAAYYSQTATALIWAVIAWCRARGKSWEGVLKKLFKNAEQYAHAMASITGPGKFIPSGDSRMDDWSGDIVPVLARLFPRSFFAGILRTSLDSGNVYKHSGTLAKSGGLIGMVYGPPEPVELEQKLPTISRLANGGKVSVLFTKNNSLTHLWLNGAEAGASHSHLDVGSFVLEVNGERIFEDPGMIEYWYTQAGLLQLTYMHNCITPVVDNIFMNQIYPIKNMTPYAHKSWDKLTIGIDCSAAWGEYFSSYTRTIKSDSDNFLSINDIIRCHHPLNVAFHLHSTFEPKVENNQVTFFTKNSRVSVDAPWSSEVYVKKDNLHFNHSDIYHIAIQSNQCDAHKLNTKIFVKKI
ncbi:MAG: heparinase II/III-family protein [Desulfovibrionaceae bacterium]|nr:heparinase II/III-family protein [Desulfovibrionaceae bacterium]